MTQSNIELMNKIRDELLGKSSISKGKKDDIRSNIIDYFKMMVTKKFNFEGIQLKELEGLNIRPDEKNIMIKISVKDLIKTSIDDAIENLLYSMNLTENNLDDLDDFLMSGYELYNKLLADFNPLTSGTIIQYFCALLEEFLRKLYSIKIQKPLGKRTFITLAKLIIKLYNFTPYQNQRKKQPKLETWQIPLIWSYELRNLMMHNVLPIPNKTFQDLFYVLTSAILIASLKMEGMS